MIRYFAGHPTAANLLMILLMAVGLASLPVLQRETLPDFSIDAAQVTVAYPGATAEEVERAVCQRIDEAVEDLIDLDEVRCEARESVASAVLEMRDGGDINRFLSEIETEIDAIDAFPEVIEDPVIRQINRTDRVVNIAVTGPMSEGDLKIFAENLKDRLIRAGGVTQVDVAGFSDRQLRIELDATALRQYGLSVSEVAEIVERQSVDLPSGTVETSERDVLLRFADERRNAYGLEDLVVLGGESGAELRLGDIGRVVDRFELAEDRVLFNGSRAALLQVSKTKDQDTLEVFDRVVAFVEAERGTLPPGVELTLTRDTASIVRDRLDMLTKNGLQGLVLVFLVLWLFFSLRLSFWVVMSLPVSFLGSLMVLTLIGYSINMLTMVGLLIAIGLIMDDSIVIAENIASHLRRKRGKGANGGTEAAVAGTGQVAMGVVASFVTSACVFLPLAFLEGNIGKVLGVVPVVLIVTLAVSLIEAFLILPHHLSHGAQGKPDNAFRRAFEERFNRLRENGLGPLVDHAVAFRYFTIGIVIMLLLLSFALVAGGGVKFRAFPDIDGDVIEARIMLPQGTPLARTEEAVAQVVEGLSRVDAALTPEQPGGAALVRNVLVRTNSNADAGESGPHLATVTVDLLEGESRSTPLDEFLALWRREVGTIPDVTTLSFKEPSFGPAGQPIEIRLQGDDLEQLKQASRELLDWLRRYAGVVDLADDLRPGKPEMRLRLREGATALGLDAATIASQLRAAYHGSTADEIQVGSESIEIDVQLGAEDQDSLADLDNFVVTLPSGAQVPLSAVAWVEPGRGFSRISRIDGRRTVIVRGDLDSGDANLNEILADTRARFLPDFEARYPGVSLALEGEAAEQSETQVSMMRGFLIGLLGIFLLLSFQFRSYVEPLIVMLAIPLALIGVIWGHFLMGLEISMPSILGFASLAGIVVNDSILLVLFVKLNAAAGKDIVAAARQASRDRFRPVLLTSLTTIAGLLPLLFERSLQAQILVPLVLSLAFGLMASTLLVLFVMPSFYAILHDFGLTTLARDKRQADSADAAEAAPAE